MWSNFHSHSNYCDGKGTLAEYLATAIESKMTSVGFSSHAPLPFECKWCMRKERLPEYVEEIEAMRTSTQNIEIYKGLEIDYIPGVVSPAEFRDALDYTIGSIHFVEALPDGRPWEIDNTQAVFEDGLERIFRNDFRAAAVRYFELTREMLDRARPDIVGHVDKLKMQNRDCRYFREDEQWYRDEILRTIDAVEQSGAIVEVNTRGLYQKKTDSTYPGPWILEIIRKKRIPVTLSSDAHLPADLVNLFPLTARMLLGLGFTHLSVLRNGAWEQVPFDQNGYR